MLVDRFVVEATERGILTQALTARPWSGRGPLPDRGRRLAPAVRIVRSGSRPGRARRRRGQDVVRDRLEHQGAQGRRAIHIVCSNCSSCRIHVDAPPGGSTRSCSASWGPPVDGVGPFKRSRSLRPRSSSAPTASKAALRAHRRVEVLHSAQLDAPDRDGEPSAHGRKSDVARYLVAEWAGCGLRALLEESSRRLLVFQKAGSDALPMRRAGTTRR